LYPNKYRRFIIPFHEGAAQGRREPFYIPAPMKKCPAGRMISLPFFVNYNVREFSRREECK